MKILQPGHMPKLAVSYRMTFYFLLLVFFARNNLAGQVRLIYHPVDKDSGFSIAPIKLETEFASFQLAEKQVTDVLQAMRLKGFWLANADSSWKDPNQLHVKLYWGDRFSWNSLTVNPKDEYWLGKLAKDPRNASDEQLIKIDFWKGTQSQLLEILEDEGYPFAQIFLDSLLLRNGEMNAQLIIQKGPLYHIDSIRLMEKPIVSRNFLYRYLEIPRGSVYRKKTLQQISARLSLLPYLIEKRPWDLVQLGTGATLQLYLEAKKSSQVNVLVGFLPATTNTQNPYEVPRTSLQFTGEANIQLRNALGSGESILFNWQQFQTNAPRLNLAYQQPFLSGSPFGVDLRFDLLKKDSSYVNVQMLAGLQIQSGFRQSSTLYIQQMQSQLLFVDTNRIKSTKKLPAELDIRTIGIGLQYEGNSTNYRFNPLKGNELLLNFSLGTRVIARNNVINQLKDPGGFSYSSLYDTIRLRTYQWRMKLAAAHYFQLNKSSTVKGSLQLGWVESPSIFRNELFQIGGYKLLRGFDEESIYASKYLVGTVEYRYLIARNSYLFAFADGGVSNNAAIKPVVSYGYIGTGLGINLETQAGQFNISLAAGKRNDLEFNARQSRIHIGYINFF